MHRKRSQCNSKGALYGTADRRIQESLRSVDQPIPGTNGLRAENRKCLSVRSLWPLSRLARDAGIAAKRYTSQKEPKFSEVWLGIFLQM